MSQALKPLATNRIDSLDYLRGLAALGIMIYHMHLFTFGEVDSSTVLARVKIYDVSIFYVLSGLTLCVVHLNNFHFTKQGLREFYVKRFFRIVPLLWLATLLTFIVAYSPEYLSVKKLIANILVIPGAIKPETFIANGAWSIGDELFFYLLFPFMMYLGKLSRAWFFSFVGVTFLILTYFSFHKLYVSDPLGKQWATYVNPIGQLFYFAAGIGIGYIEKGMQKFGSWSIVGIVVAFALIAFYPASGEPIHLVTGVTRLVLSLFVTALCFLVYKTNFDFLPDAIRKIFTFLGEVSFSLYLIHPIVYFGLKHVLSDSPYVLVALTITLTVVLSYFSYTYFEKRFIRMGKAVNNRFKVA
jgi:exopolysaccharide production protein ExoZ